MEITKFQSEFKAVSTKKEVETTAEQVALSLIDSGNVSNEDLLTNAKKLYDFASKYFETIKNKVYGNVTLDKFNGVLIAIRGGGKKLNYSEDPVYAEMERKLKSRKELLDLAFKTKEPIFDSEGVEVPKVSFTEGKDQIVLTY
jgi:hypothetical protein